MRRGLERNLWTPFAVALARETLPWMRYPPVGASQSSISPVAKTPGMDFIIKLLFKVEKGSPPVEEMDSLNGRGFVSSIGTFFM